MKRSYSSFFPMRAVFCAALLLAPAGELLLAQQPPELPPPSQALTPDQLDDLVAPIALYPDPLVSQILVASTYPLELVQASQWLQRNPGLTGAALTQAAQQQNWDPSIQALVVFPDLVKRLNQDITWTTNLGNAFLSQQGDVMDAVQRMRLKAQQAGKLSSTSQQTVTTTNDSGQPVIEIEPANPQMIYLPQYDPAYIWGPPLYYPYASWYYPGAYFGFGIGIPMGLYFGGGWGGWGGWGWQPGWGGHNIIVNNNFIHRYNFNSRGSASLNGRSALVPRCLASPGRAVFKRCRGQPLSRQRAPKSAIARISRTDAGSRRYRPIRSRANGQSAGLPRAHPAGTVALSAAFGRAARRGCRATMDIRASGPPGAAAEAPRAGEERRAGVAAAAAEAAAAVVVDIDRSERESWRKSILLT